MNERIKELKEQARDFYLNQEDLDWSPQELHNAVEAKFAELIVKECVHVALKDALPDWGNQASEANAQCVKIASDLKEHFGVE